MRVVDGEDGVEDILLNERSPTIGGGVYFCDCKREGISQEQRLHRH